MEKLSVNLNREQKESINFPATFYYLKKQYYNILNI